MAAKCNSFLPINCELFFIWFVHFFFFFFSIAGTEFVEGLFDLTHGSK